jgi:PAS domain S-box-containing protein
MRDEDPPVRLAAAGHAEYRPGVSSPSDPVASMTTPTDSERQLQSIVELAADAIISTDASLNVTLFNGAAERIFGYRRDEVLGQPLDMLLPETARGSHRGHVESFSRAAATNRRMGERGQIWGRRRSGELFPAEASISKSAIGGAMHYTAILRDVTRALRSEAERESLLVAERTARAAAEAAEHRMEFLARAGDLLHASLVNEETFSALAAMIVPALATYCVIDLVEEDGAVRRVQVHHADPDKQALADQLREYPKRQSAYLTRHAIMTGEAELVGTVTDAMLAERAEDTHHLGLLRALAPVSYVVAPLRTRDRTIGAILLARDARAVRYDGEDLALVVELAKRAASALENGRLYQQARIAIEARDGVLGIVSHDLRNPLSVIGMCVASLLTGGTGDDARTREALQTMQESVWWSQRLIQDLLDVTSVEAGGLSVTRTRQDPVLLVARAAHFFEEIAEQRGITLRLDLPEELPAVDADADRILQAVGNLISNAVKFTPAGGTVRVGAALVNGRILCFVADSGPGVPPDDVPHIFDRFWTARRNARVRGTGMGLAIVHGIARAHGAAVSLERAPEGGAMFILALEAAPLGGTTEPD